MPRRTHIQNASSAGKSQITGELATLVCTNPIKSPQNSDAVVKIGALSHHLSMIFGYHWFGHSFCWHHTQLLPLRLPIHRMLCPQMLWVFARSPLLRVLQNTLWKLHTQNCARFSMASFILWSIELWVILRPAFQQSYTKRSPGSPKTMFRMVLKRPFFSNGFESTLWGDYSFTSMIFDFQGFSQDSFE